MTVPTLEMTISNPQTMRTYTCACLSPPAACSKRSTIPVGEHEHITRGREQQEDNRDARDDEQRDRGCL